MSKRKKRSDPSQHAGQWNADDGVDPRYYFSATQQNNAKHRKARQLCRQVQNTLQFVLHGDGSDDLLNSLMVVDVQPAPDTSRLLVVVQSDLPAQQIHPGETISVLNNQIGRLRSEIARSIHRKKTPQLMFQLQPHSLTVPEQDDRHQEN